jgi:hypothetical protein
MFTGEPTAIDEQSAGGDDVEGTFLLPPGPEDYTITGKIF